MTRPGSRAAWTLRSSVVRPSSPACGRASSSVVRDARPALFTVLGGAGIGKSRLARELEASSSDVARVLTGRCLPYGDGITYWPLFEIVRDLVGEDEDPRPAIARLVAGQEGADAITERIAGILGHSTEAGTAEETSWAVRRLFESLARERPLVVVFEDLHWSEPTLLDLIEYIADWSRDVPVFILCLARPELLEKRPRWGGGEDDASLLLAPLTAAESDALIESLQGEASLPPETRTRIAETAEGNPLYVEQMVAMLAEGDPLEEIPPTIQGLLAARLDRLSPDERAVIERACVVGKRFWAAAVVDLSPESARDSVAASLELLVRKDFIDPEDRPVVPGEEGYRFGHQLIRDAAYNGIPKGERAGLHERFARLIEERAGPNVVEVEEILGYHLEQAVRYRHGAGPPRRARGCARARGSRAAGAGGPARPCQGGRSSGREPARASRRPRAEGCSRARGAARRAGVSARARRELHRG